MLRNIPEERRSHLHRGESLKSREIMFSNTVLSDTLREMDIILVFLAMCIYLSVEWWSENYF
jgi:hypothetical protein